MFPCPPPNTNSLRSTRVAVWARQGGGTSPIVSGRVHSIVSVSDTTIIRNVLPNTSKRKKETKKANTRAKDTFN